MRLRIPGWCKRYSVVVNDDTVTVGPTIAGYLVLEKEWRSGDQIILNMDMPVEMIQADGRVKENIGKRAIQRGALLYCMEETDNPTFNELSLSSDTQFKTIFNPSLLNGVVTISATTDDAEITLVPYYA